MIQERESMKHGLRYLVRVDWQGKRYTVGTYSTKAKAKKAEREARNRIDAGTFIPPSEAREQKTKPEPKITTVTDAMNAWLDTKRGSVTANTAELYASAMRLHILPALGSTDVTELRYDQIQQVVNRWRDDGMGARLIDRCVVILKDALQRQARAGTIPFNPAAGVEKPEIRTKKELPVWSDEQIGRFLAVAMRERFAPFWALTLIEGFRRGEALGLRWSDLRWSDDGGCIATIDQTIVQNLADRGALLIQNRTKTKGSRRSVQLTPTTITVLLAHRDRQRFERQRLADLWTDHDLIVTNGAGGPINPANIGRNLKRVIAEAEVPAVTVHGLRHIASTIMLRSGVSPALVAQKIGHTDISTTFNIYGHLIASDQSVANAAIEAVVSKKKRGA